MKQFSEPKIFTGGVDLLNWHNLTLEQQEKALSKRWYVYFSYRDPETKRLVRQKNIHWGANEFKSKEERIKYLKVVRIKVLAALNLGFNPYSENQPLYDKHWELSQAKSSSKTVIQKPKPNLTEAKSVDYTVEKAFEIGLEQKKAMMSYSSFTKYRSRISSFMSWLSNLYDIEKDGIESVVKSDIMKFLNETLIRTSPRNRNNTRTDISSLFQLLEDNDILKENFVKKINVLKAVPVRNKTYTLDQQVELFKHLRNNDPILLLFVKFISYNFLRPIEVCRLKVKDIDLAQKKLYVRAKNKPVKTKIIPEILIKDLNIAHLSGENLLFTPDALGGEWDANEGSRRDHFTKRFKKVKDQFELGSEYGLYSFRHTFITKLYQEFAATMSPSETKGKLMLITGHTTLKALEAYLRDLDAVMPEDYSKYL